MENKDIDEILDGIFTIFPLFRKKIQKIGEDMLKDKGISKAHIQLMKSLKSEGACTMTDLGKRLSVSKPNITALVDRLVELDAVKRVFIENDRRIIYIELTDQGKELLDAHIEAMKATLAKSMQNFSNHDLVLFKEAMDNMKMFINKMDLER